MVGLVSQDLIGSALPAIEGDELDVTLPEKAKEPESVTANVTPDVVSSVDNVGLSALQKLIFFGVILGAVAIFMRTRSKGRGLEEKSLA